jgi:hypothetical protein
MNAWIVIDNSASIKDLVNSIIVFTSYDDAVKERNIQIAQAEGLDYFDINDIYIHGVIIK